MGNKPAVMLLGPELKAVSGVSTHVRCLLESRLGLDFDLRHFLVGSEGRDENTLQMLLRHLSSPFRLAGTILSHKVAVVHINSSLMQRSFWRDLCFLIIGKMLGCAIVYQVHGGPLPQQFFRGRALTALLRWTLRVPDAIVVLAQAELEAYRAFVPARPVMALPNAIDCSPYVGLARARADPAQPLKLAYFGRLIRAKGLYELLEAMRIARAHGVRAVLTIAGSGPEEPALRQHADKLGVGAEVRFTGPLFGERKLELLARSDAFVLATYHPEGLPYALLEAMAAGLPVITTRIGAIPDVAVDGVHGLFVPTGDPDAIYRAIDALSADRELLARMSAACQARVAAAYSMDRLCDELHGVYSALCAAKPVKELPPCAE